MEPCFHRRRGGERYRGGTGAATYRESWSVRGQTGEGVRGGGTGGYFECKCVFANCSPSLLHILLFAALRHSLALQSKPDAWCNTHTHAHACMRTQILEEKLTRRRRKLKK